MEKRDYIEREIEKMRAVVQKILRLRVDRPQEAQALAETEMEHYFHHALDDLVNMNDASFETFIEPLLPSMLDFLGNLMYASVDSAHKLTRRDQVLLHRTVITWDLWERKTQTADWEKMIRKDEINQLLSAC
ncbi:MAG: hypothetical protein ACP5F6_08900 [Microbacter sp.]